MIFRSVCRTLSAVRGTAAVAGAMVLGLALGGCVENEIQELGAQNAAETPEEPAAPAIAVEDTLTLTAAEAVALTLATNAALQAEASAQVREDAENFLDEMAAAEGDDPADQAAQQVADGTPAIPPAEAAASPVRYNSGEDPNFAARYGWPVTGPKALPGSILPENRIVCYYGNPNSTRMGALGEFPKDEMLTRLSTQIAAWETADPNVPVKPCLHMVAVVAQAEAGTSGHYRSIMRDETVQMVYDWAREVDGIFIVDIQPGTDDIRNILPRFEWILKNPDVHLAVDPEFYMKGGTPPGRRIGTMDAADINYASEYLADLVREHDLPPKVFIVHRFTQPMVTNHEDIRLRPEVQVILHMDGWGAPWLKRDSYRDFIVREPVQFTGLKIFYGNDTRNGTPLMMPEDVLRLRPVPFYIQYQ
ncbi:MAG: hypothetical protein WD737_02300 [Gemmatimonadota bacterium]